MKREFNILTKLLFTTNNPIYNILKNRINKETMNQTDNVKKIYTLGDDNEKVNIDGVEYLINTDKHIEKYKYVLNPKGPAPECQIETDGYIQQFNELTLLGFREKTHQTQRYRVLGEVDNSIIQKCEQETKNWDSKIIKWDRMLRHFDFDTAPIGLIIKKDIQQKKPISLLYLALFGTAIYCFYYSGSIVCKSASLYGVSALCNITQFLNAQASETARSGL